MSEDRSTLKGKSNSITISAESKDFWLRIYHDAINALLRHVDQYLKVSKIYLGFIGEDQMHELPKYEQHPPIDQPEDLGKYLSNLTSLRGQACINSMSYLEQVCDRGVIEMPNRHDLAMLLADKRRRAMYSCYNEIMYDQGEIRSLYDFEEYYQAQLYIEAASAN